VYVGIDWTAREVAHLSYVPVVAVAEALCGALIVPAAEADVPSGTAQPPVTRCVHCARALIRTSGPRALERVPT
jgi:hypothetical protein